MHFAPVHSSNAAPALRSLINVALCKMTKLKKRSLLNKRIPLEIEEKEQEICRPVFVHKTIILSEDLKKVTMF